MKNGAGTPYINIEDFEGNVLNYLVTQFQYVFSEESDDFTTITLESSDPYFPDHKGLQEDRMLYVTWGYRESPLRFNSRKAFIRECIPDYKENGISLQLKCSDKGSYMRQNKQRRTFDGNAIDITQQIADEHGLELELKLYINEGDTTVDRIKAKKYEGYPQAGINDMTFLNEIWAEQEGGPYVIDGRDSKLIIKRRDYNQKPKRSFTYNGEPYDLLRFKPETKNRMYGKKARKNKIIFYDPITQSLKALDIDAIKDKTTRLGEVDNYSKDYFVSAVLSDQNIQVFNQITPINGAHPDDANLEITADERSYGYYHGPSLINQRENTSTLDKVVKRRIKNTSQYPIGQQNDLSGNPAWDEFSAENRAISERQNAASDTNPGNAVVIGDPLLECSTIMTFLGIAKKWAGNYYVVRATHDISQNNGFTVELSLKRNARTKTGNEGPGRADISTITKVNKTAGGYTVKVGNKTVIVSEDDIDDFKRRKLSSGLNSIRDVDQNRYDRYNNPYPED